VRIYETAFIVNPQSDDATIDRQVVAVTDLIKNNGGEIVREERIGTRRLAYEIAGLTQGYFASILFNGEPGVLPLLERHYKLEEPYVRYITIRFEGDPNQTGSIIFDRPPMRGEQDERPGPHGFGPQGPAPHGPGPRGLAPDMSDERVRGPRPHEEPDDERPRKPAVDDVRKNETDDEL
jgi:small subunit ribosomal protein S6